MVEIGTKIRALRETKKMTQKELAKVLHVTPQAISKWELNKSYPDLDTLLRLSQFFKVSTDKLLGNEKQSFFEGLFATMKGKINMLEPSTTDLPKAELIQVMSGILKITFDNGVEKYLKSHALQATLQEGNQASRKIPKFFDTKIVMNEDGSVVLNGEDCYTREELWYQSQSNINPKWGFLPFGELVSLLSKIFT